MLFFLSPLPYKKSDCLEPNLPSTVEQLTERTVRKHATLHFRHFISLYSVRLEVSKMKSFLSFILLGEILLAVEVMSVAESKGYLRREHSLMKPYQGL